MSTGASHDVISSPHNARVAAARKLLQGKERAAAHAFLVEGPHAVGEALSALTRGVGGMAVRELFVTPAAAQRDVDLLRAADSADVPIALVDERVCARLSDTQHPQGIVAVVGTSRRTVTDVLRAGPRLVTVLCRVADPGNAGTVIRTSDAAGAGAVVLTRGSVDPYGGKCVRATAGSLFHLPIVTGVAPEPTVTAMREAGLSVLAAALDGDDLDALPDEELQRPTAWLFGSEAHGLDPATAAAADRRVRVPIHGAAESLNLAAAAAVCLYASARAQHR